MPTRIARLELTRFRGASGEKPAVVDFAPEKSMVMVFGENGTGKSTLVDAIDAVCNGDLGSIRRRSVGHAPWQHVPSIGADPDELRVVLKTRGEGEFHATLSGKGVDVRARAEGGGLPLVHVLRRSDLLKLVEAKPAERYQELRAFVAVEGIESSEQSLRQLAVDFRRSSEQAATRQQEAAEVLDDHWRRERQDGEDHEDAVAWAEARVVEDVEALRRRSRLLAQIESDLQGLERHVGAWESARVGAAQAASRSGEAKSKVGDAALSEALRPALLRVLQAGDSYLGTAPRSGVVVEECPLCEQPVDPAELRSRTQTRLTGLDAVKRMVDEAERAATAEKQAWATLLNSERTVRRALDELEGRFDECVPEALAALGFGPGTFREALAETEGAEVPDRAVQLSRTAIGVAGSIREEADAVRSRLEVHDNTVDILRRVKANTADVDEDLQLQARIDRAVEVVASTRKAYTERTLDEVTDEVNRLYKAIHPGEDIGLDRLVMSRKSSVDQHARFQGHDGVKPQAYFSESHLDTFGFCLWLALAKRTSQGRGVLVLDDVFTSVDAPHFRRVTDLLADEAGSFQQLIIATHNRQWHQFYRQAGVGVHLIKLERWTLDRGLRAYEERLAIEDLQAAIDADQFDRQAVASQAGILLEALLDDVSLIFQCRLPRSWTNEYTLGSLLDGTTKVMKVAKLTRAKADTNGDLPDPPKWEEIELAEPLRRVQALSFIRNQVGAHFNLAGLSLSDADVEEFGRASLDLALAVRCPRCGQVPSRDRGDHLGCRCKKHRTRLVPMTAP